MRVQNRLVFVAAAVAASSVWAADRTWTGSVSSDWANPGNWSLSGVPGTADTVIIPGSLEAGAVYPVLAAGTTVDGLKMAAGAQLTLNSGVFEVARASESVLNGTITVIGGSSQLLLNTGSESDWANGGTMVFREGGNFKPISEPTALRPLFNNTGTIQAQAGSIVFVPFETIHGGMLDGAWWARSTGGEYQLPHSYELNLSSTTLGGSFSVESQNSDLSKAKLTLIDAVTNNSAVFNFPAYGSMALAVTSGSTFTFSGSGGLGLQGQTLAGTGVNTIANQGTHTLSGYGTIGAASLTNAGTVQATGGTSGALQSLNVGTLSNQGTVIVDQYNTLHVSGNVTSGASSLFHVNGTLEAPSVSVAGWLTGGGTIITSSGVTLLNGSTLAPGNSPGTLTIAGDLTMDGGAHWDIEAGDKVDVTGTLIFQPGVTIALDVAPGTLGGPYTFLTGQNVVGVPEFTFPGVQGVVIRDGNAFSFQVPEPTIVSMLGASSLLTLRRRRNR